MQTQLAAKVYLLQRTGSPLSPMTTYCLRKGQMMVINPQMVFFSLLLSAGAGGERDICILWGREIYRALLEKASKGLPGKSLPISLTVD